MYVVRGVDQNQPRLIQRAIRLNANIRRNITASQLTNLVSKCIVAESPLYTVMIQAVEKLATTTPVTAVIDDKNQFQLDEVSASKKDLPGREFSFKDKPRIHISINIYVLPFAPTRA